MKPDVHSEMQAAGVGDHVQTVDTVLGIPIPLDVEKQPPMTAADASDIPMEEDVYLVSFDGPDDPRHPFNWSLKRKWTITILVSFSGLNMLMSSTMIAPALTSIGNDLHMSESTTQMAMTIFVLAFAFGPMILSPLSEVFGRKKIWIGGGLFFILWNTICGFSRTKGLLIAAKFLSGLGGSVDFTLGGPISADMWRPEQRGISLAMATFVPLLGPALGPILGGLITERVGWRWIFWTMSIYDAVVLVTALLFYTETYAPVLLYRKASKLRKSTGKPYHTKSEHQSRNLPHKIYVSLIRPLHMLALEPIIQVMSIAMAINFSFLYIVLSTFAEMWTTRYQQSVSESGLNYIALVIGYIIANQVGGRLTDRLWRYLQNKAGGDTAPEYRVPLMIPGNVLQPIGLLWYGWSAQHHLHWIMPDIGVAIFGCGTILSTVACQAYVLDAYKTYSASASAASQLLRNILAFAFPLFAPKMYHALGYGWGNTVLACVFLVVGVPVPILIWNYGARLRSKGRSLHQ